MDKDQIEDDLEEEIEVDEPEPEAPPPEEVEARKEIEEQARKYGWRPKEEFDRDPSGWVDADRFLDLPATKVKMHRDTQKHLEKELRDRDERLARMEGMTKQAIEAVRKQEAERYQAQLASLTAAQRRAAEEGDLERFDRIEEQKARLQPPPVAPAAPQEDPLAQYRASEEGKWVNDEHARRFAAQLVESNPHVKYLPPLKQAQWAASQVKDYFPEYFPTQEPPRRDTRQRVDGGGLGAPLRRGKGADDLPAEAAKVAQEFVKEGIYKSVEDYARDYWAQEAGR